MRSLRFQEWKLPADRSSILTTPVCLVVFVLSCCLRSSQPARLDWHNRTPASFSNNERCLVTFKIKVDDVGRLSFSLERYGQPTKNKTRETASHPWNNGIGKCFPKNCWTLSLLDKKSIRRQPPHDSKGRQLYT